MRADERGCDVSFSSNRRSASPLKKEIAFVCKLSGRSFANLGGTADIFLSLYFQGQFFVLEARYENNAFEKTMA